MEDLLEIYTTVVECDQKLEKMSQDFLHKLRATLWGANAPLANSNEETPIEQQQVATPQQTTKRLKRLSSLQEDDLEEDNGLEALSLHTRTGNAELLVAAAEVMDVVQPAAITPAPKTLVEQHSCVKPQQPLIPSVNETVAVVSSEQSFARPQRAAKLKSEKNLKEPKLNCKMRRPSKLDDVTVKLEHEQRASQMHETTATLTRASSKSASLISTRSDDIIVLPEKTPSVVELLSEDEVTESNNTQKNNNSIESAGDSFTKGRQLRVKIKREKMSLPENNNAPLEVPVESVTNVSATVMPPPAPVPMLKEVNLKSETVNDESTTSSSILSATSTAVVAKKSRKKKHMPVPKPIKVERLSDIIEAEPKQTEERAPSIYEDAVENLPCEIQTDAIRTPPSHISKVPESISGSINETVTINATIAGKTNTTMLPPSDATYCANVSQTTFQVAPGQTTFVMSAQNPNTTVTLAKKSGPDAGDATFNVALSANADEAQQSFASTQHSMETARDTLTPQPDKGITESDLSTQQREVPKTKPILIQKIPSMSKLMTSKTYKMTTRANEFLNTPVQSPVKKIVEAFENAAKEQSKSTRPKRIKENYAFSSTQSASNITPHAGKVHAPNLGRFLTPTQSSNITPNVAAKKAPNSASKILGIPKINTNLKSTNSSSTKTLSRENSAEDFRKGIHQIVEERKKLREQKHLLAAQQREAKERERAERMAKVAKEREEKRLKKQMEAEQKKRDLEEIQRKLRQQDEAIAAATKHKATTSKAIIDQEQELLMQMKQRSASAKGKMLPPPPKPHIKYSFEMLHEDDSTDDEGKTSYKRPPPPTWSRSTVRGPAILMQQYWPTSIIDSFFSVQPTTPDLKAIFPNIDARHLKRNSSVLWSTPPRYSELPKY